MRISRLILKLQSLKRQYGDIEVTGFDGHPIERVDVADGNNEHVRRDEPSEPRRELPHERRRRLQISEDRSIRAQARWFRLKQAASCNRDTQA